MVNKLAHNIYSFEVVLPDNPLKWLNTYVITGENGGRNLLIDTGFNRPECLNGLLSGMRELGIKPEDTDVFLTHLHADHTGNAPALAKLGCKILMGRIDYEVYMGNTNPDNRRRALQEGVSPEVLEHVFKHNPATLYSPGRFNAELLEENDMLHYGGYALRCVLTPGHTPGHLCLHDEQHKLIFLGDHILFGITPNIQFWSALPDALGSYMESLQRVRQLEVELALPGHRTAPSNVSFRQRVDSLYAHHVDRLQELEGIIREKPGLSGYQLAGLMSWRIRANSWDEFPPGQKWFALSEALSHIDHLLAQGRITRGEDAEGNRSYFAV